MSTSISMSISIASMTMARDLAARARWNRVQGATTWGGALAQGGYGPRGYGLGGGTEQLRPRGLQGYGRHLERVMES